MYIHSGLFKLHHKFKIDKNNDEFFTGFCQEENHSEELEFFCKTHNQLCCSSCLCKIKKYNKGQHHDCDACIIEDIKYDKKNKLNDNIKYLEDLSKTLQESINELKKVFQKVNESKEIIKVNIQHIFTKLRNILNDREDKLLIDVEEKFDKLFFKEEIIKESEK